MPLQTEEIRQMPCPSVLIALAKWCFAPSPAGAATTQAADCKAVSVDVFTGLSLTIFTIFWLTLKIILDAFN